MIAGKPLQAWLARADELGAEGCFFEAHEELEIPWKAAEGDEKILLQGLIQLAAGLHRLRLHPEKPGGAFYLLDRGLQKLDRARALLTQESLTALEAAMKKIRAGRKAPVSLRFGLSSRGRKN